MPVTVVLLHNEGLWTHVTTVLENLLEHPTQVRSDQLLLNEIIIYKRFALYLHTLGTVSASPSAYEDVCLCTQHP